MPNPYLDYLIYPSFQGVIRLLVLSFENSRDRTLHTKYYLPVIEIKDYNVMTNGQNIFDQPVKNNLKTYNVITFRILSLFKEMITILGCLLY